MDFVTFEIAKKLKEKGFREKCLCRYKTYSKTLHINEVETQHPRDIDYSEFLKCYNYYVHSDIDAPTIPQVLDWLRKEKKLHIRASVYFIGWCVDVTNMDGKRMYSTECEYPNYEQAALTGIEYVLDNLI